MSKRYASAQYTRVYDDPEDRKRKEFENDDSLFAGMPYAKQGMSTGSLHDSLLPFLSSQAMADPKIAAAIKAAVNSEVHAAAKGGELPKMKAEAAERRKAAPLHRKHPHKGKGEGKAEGK